MRAGYMPSVLHFLLYSSLTWSGSALKAAWERPWWNTASVEAASVEAAPVEALAISSAGGLIRAEQKHTKSAQTPRDAAQESLGASTDNPVDMVSILAGVDTLFQENKSPFWAGSLSNGNTLPQIKMPWGFNDWAPQTRGAEDGEGGGGTQGAFWFHSDDKKFQGMRCTHEPSPWLGDYGHFVLQPHIDDAPRDLEFSSSNSTFRPYLFSTALEGIGFEFAPTSHAALMQVTFPESAKTGHLSLRIADGKLSIMKGKVIRGNTNNMFVTVKALSKVDDSANLLEATSTGYADKYHDGRRGTLKFDPKDGPALIAVATSFISQEQADLSLEQEVGSKSFSDVMAEGKRTWNKQLNRVQAEALDKEQLVVFYTNLWKAQLFPRYLQEVNAAGEEEHRSPYTKDVRKGKLVADSGFWDSYNTVYPLQSLVFADNLGSLIDGWVDAYSEAKWLPQWPSPGEHGSMMVGTMGDVPLADAIAKSKWGFLTGFNVSKAYEAIRKDAFALRDGEFGRDGLADYIENGYVSDDVSESVSRTLNNYLCDAAISRAAGMLGKHDDEKLLSERSKRYGVLFDPATKFFRPKDRSGEFLPRFDPQDYHGFTEASAWQYRFYVPHDVEGLVKLYGGKDQLCNAVQDMFSFHKNNPGSKPKIDARFPELFGVYWHGNQPVHHVLYVAKKAGCNALADKYLRATMDKLYTTNGWAGDEDNGEMSSWYILSALGVYSLEGAKDELVLGSPAIKRATVQLVNNKVLTIDAKNQAKEHVYVQSVTWTPYEGSPRTINDNVIKFTELMQGGTLTFMMGAFPQSL